MGLMNAVQKVCVGIKPCCCSKDLVIGASPPQGLIKYAYFFSLDVSLHQQWLLLQMLIFFNYFLNIMIYCFGTSKNKGTKQWYGNELALVDRTSSFRNITDSSKTDLETNQTNKRWGSSTRLLLFHKTAFDWKTFWKLAVTSFSWLLCYLRWWVIEWSTFTSAASECFEKYMELLAKLDMSCSTWQRASSNQTCNQKQTSANTSEGAALDSAENTKVHWSNSPHLLSNNKPHHTELC